MNTYLTLAWAGLVAAAAGFVALGLRFRCRYDVRRDYRQTFSAENRVSCRIVDGKIVGANLADYSDHSMLLVVNVRSGVRGLIRDPGVRLWAGSRETVQYFERGASGIRFIDLSAFAGCAEPVRFESLACACSDAAELLAFRNPLLGGNILVVAPHPDDAELGAFGLYSLHPERTTIVNVSAGEGMRGRERPYIAGLDGSPAAAVRRKGTTRALDAVTAPRWGNVDPAAVIQLGYFNDTLAVMEQDPEAVVPQRDDPSLRPADFRRFNHCRLPSDVDGANRWQDLVADFVELLRRIRPAVVVTTDPHLDPHPDHGAATRALCAAMELSGYRPTTLLYYATHVRGTDEYPFGPPHCTAGPAPWFDARGPARGYFSVELSPATQLNKVCAMEAMHDLRSTARLEKRIKRFAQAIVGGRRWPHYGEHNYFRTAVKANEIFLVERSD